MNVQLVTDVSVEAKLGMCYVVFVVLCVFFVVVFFSNILKLG